MSLEGLKKVTLQKWGGLDLESETAETSPTSLREALNVVAGTKGIEARFPIKWEAHVPGNATSLAFGQRRVMSLIPSQSSVGGNELFGMKNDGSWFVDREKADFQWSASGSGAESLNLKEPRAVGVSKYGRVYMGLSDGREPLDYPRMYESVPGNSAPRLYPIGMDPPAGMLSTADGTSGNVVVGNRNAVVCYVSRWGDVSPPSFVKAFSTGGSKRLTISNIPIGPSWVTARWIFISPIGGGRKMYCIQAAQVGDNSTTSIDIDFDETTLLSGTELAAVSRCYPVPACRGIGSVGDRIAAFGARPYVYPHVIVYEPPVGYTTFANAGVSLGLQNVRLNGGAWTTVAQGDIPGGWTTNGANSYGISRIQSGTGALGDCVRITGNGSAGRDGKIFQSGLFVRSSQGFPTYLFQPGRKYGVRIKTRTNFSGSNAKGKLRVTVCYGSSVGGTVWLDLWVKTYDAGGVYTNARNVDVGTYNTSLWQTYESTTATFDASQGAGQFCVLVGHDETNGALYNNEQVEWDWLEFFEDGVGESSQIYFSNSLRPGMFDWLTGVRTASKDDGQAVMSVFSAFNQYWIVKENSVHSLTEIAGTEPAQWVVQKVSQNVGTNSVDGICVGQNFAVIGDDSGVYAFTGAEPILLTDEISTVFRSNMGGQSNMISYNVPLNRREMRVGIDDSQKEIHVFAGTEWWVCDYADGLGRGQRAWRNNVKANPSHSNYDTDPRSFPTACCIAQRRDNEKRLLFAFTGMWAKGGAVANDRWPINGWPHTDLAPKPGSGGWSGLNGVTDYGRVWGDCFTRTGAAVGTVKFQPSAATYYMTSGSVAIPTSGSPPTSPYYLNFSIDVRPVYGLGFFGAPAQIRMEFWLDGAKVASQDYTCYPNRWRRISIFPWQTGAYGSNVEIRIYPVGLYAAGSQMLVSFSSPCLSSSQDDPTGTSMAGDGLYVYDTSAGGNWTTDSVGFIGRFECPSDPLLPDCDLYDCYGGGFPIKWSSGVLADEAYRIIMRKFLARITGQWSFSQRLMSKSGGASDVQMVASCGSQTATKDYEQNVRVEGHAIAITGQIAAANWLYVANDMGFVNYPNPPAVHEFNVWVQAHPQRPTRFNAP